MSGYDNFRRSADDIDTNLQLTITNRRYAFIYLKGQEGFKSTSSADNGTPGDGGEIAFCIDLFSFSDVYNTLTFSGLTGGDGGTGVSSSITGSAVTRAGGGGGGIYTGSAGGSGGAGGGGAGIFNGTPGVGTVNTGSGGGGVGRNAGGGMAGGAGGSGVVIIRYKFQ